VSDERKHRSVSQINQYSRCPYSYKLARIDKVWQRPAAWLGQGSAVHEAAEAYEKSGRTMTLDEAQDVFRESYAKHINEACEVTPNLEWWFASGPYGGERDIERRFGIGLEQVERYIRWYEKHPEEVIWIAPDGTPGIELGFDIDLDGVLVRGYIDAVIQLPGLAGDNDDGSPRPEVLVRDNKTGNTPGDDFQLGVYGVALAEQFGIEPPQLGDYWMGKSGKPTYPYDLGEWTREAVTARFHELEANIAAERFDPDPEPSKCNFCDVALSCEYSQA
jgi:putative RecB family exonuclease